MKIELKLTPQKIITKALEITQKIQNAYSRAEALAAIAEAQAKAGQDPSKTIAEALATTQKIQDPDNKAKALATIAKAMAEKGYTAVLGSVNIYNGTISIEAEAPINYISIDLNNCGDGKIEYVNPTPGYKTTQVLPPPSRHHAKSQ